MGTPARQRLAEVSGRWRLCEVQGCQRQTQKWGKYCEVHDGTNERTGHPDGHTVRASTVRPYRDMASEFIRDHKGHPAIKAALRWLTVLVYTDRPPVNHLGQNAAPHLRVNRWLDKMKRQGIRPEEMLAMIAAVYLLREDHPRDFKSDRHFNHQLVVRLLRMIRAPSSERWAGGKRYLKYDRVTVKVRDHLSKQINDALGLMCLRMTKVILKPNPLDGIETPFETTRTKGINMTNPTTNMYSEALGIGSHNSQASEQQPTSHNENRIMRTIVRSDGSQEYSAEGVTRGDTAHMGKDATGVFSEMRTREGTPLRMDELQPDSVVTVPGIGQMQLRSALSAGFVSKTGDGSYSKGAGEQPRQEAPKEVHPDLQTVEVNPDAEKAYNTLLGETMGLTQVAAIQEIAKGGDVSERTIARLASEMGTEPGAMAPLLETARAGFEQQARQAIAESGVDPEAVLAWAYEERPGEMTKAIDRQMMKRNFDGYRQIASEYVRNLDSIDPDAILNADLANGLQAHRDHKGRVILTDNLGRTFEWKSAVQAGIISFG